MVFFVYVKKKNDVGIVIIFGILIVLIFYVVIIVFLFGILLCEVIVVMLNFLMMGIMEYMIGISGKILIIFCLIVFVFVFYMSWIMFLVEVMY